MQPSATIYMFQLVGGSKSSFPTLPEVFLRAIIIVVKSFHVKAYFATVVTSKKVCYAHDQLVFFCWNDSIELIVDLFLIILYIYMNDRIRKTEGK